MRPVREITAKEENWRTEPLISGQSRFQITKRDPVEPEPVGTIVMMAFRVTGYDQDCDGSLMARLEAIDARGEMTGWCPNCIGLYPNTDLVVTLDEWRSMFSPPKD